MSKKAVRGGDVAGLLERFAQLRKKAQARTGRNFPIIVIQEAGLDGFWIHRVLQNAGAGVMAVPDAILLLASAGVPARDAFCERQVHEVADDEVCATRRDKVPGSAWRFRDASKNWRVSLLTDSIAFKTDNYVNRDWDGRGEREGWFESSAARDSTA